jgi:DNA-binding CsgD family transcriptional regulator
VCEQVDGAVETAEQMHYLDGIQSESLLMLGRVRDAEHHARAALESALDSLDGLGIRVNAFGLAVVQGVRGLADEAWRTLTVSLRLGSPGPLENTYYRRSLALGTLLRSRVGDTELARSLSTELDRTPSGYTPLLQSMGEVARTTIDPDPAKVEELWEAGERHVENGLLLPALWCWLAHPGPHSPERMRQVRDLYSRCHVPLLDSLVRLHEALSAGDLAMLEELAGPRTTVVNDAPHRTAWTMLGGRHGDGSALDPSGQGDPGQGPPLLTTRERQIALLARDGLSNREIATEFTLSVRTVENHMSSLLHKLGFTSRQDLTLHMFV